MFPARKLRRVLFGQAHCEGFSHVSAEARRRYCILANHLTNALGLSPAKKLPARTSGGLEAQSSDCKGADGPLQTRALRYILEMSAEHGTRTTCGRCGPRVVEINGEEDD